MGPSSPENWRVCACRMCDLNCGRRAAPGDVVMERRREMFRSGECPAVSLPLHLPSASFAEQQFGTGHATINWLHWRIQRLDAC